MLNDPSPTPENARPVSSDGMLNSRPAPTRRQNANGNGNEVMIDDVGRYRYEDSNDDGLLPQISQEEERDPDYCCIWPFTLLKDRPVLRLVILLILNFVSNFQLQVSDLALLRKMCFSLKDIHCHGRKWSAVHDIRFSPHAYRRAFTGLNFECRIILIRLIRKNYLNTD